jgi:hypothetical protein
MRSWTLLSLLAILAPAWSGAFVVPLTVTTLSTRPTVSSSVVSPVPSLPTSTTISRSPSLVLLFPSTSSAAEEEEDEVVDYFQFNPLYGGLLAAFLTYGIFLSPGEIFSDIDNGMLQAYMDNPSQPQGINELFLCIFNGLGIMPLVLSQLVVPQGNNKSGLPAAPFLLASAAMGYGGLGVYLSLRAAPVESKTQDSEVGWITRNVLENKFFNFALVALCGTTVLSSGVLYQDFTTVLSGFQDLIATSKLASVSSVDLFILTIVAATLIPRDYQLRVPDVEDNQANIIAASTLLVPIVGAALYCAWRPSLPESE